MPTRLPITGPVRIAIVGLGQIAELVAPTYLGRDDVQVVALCDPDPDALARWTGRCPARFGRYRSRHALLPIAPTWSTW